MTVDGYRAHLEKVEFKDSGITVVGISADPVPAIKDFATKHNVTVCALCHTSPPPHSCNVLALTTTINSTLC